jgi:tRNA threonylcarbamoyladenosine biosynthesis protein TsaB
LSYLFIDSTYELIVGVLNEELDWLTFEKLAGVKASATIQAKTFELLNQHSIKSHELKGIISVHGPGFYTGLRLAEGFSDVFKFFNIPTFSFYSYDVPKFCGYKKGSWFTKAYRGEYFFYRWENEKNEHCYRKNSPFEIL